MRLGRVLGLALWAWSLCSVAAAEGSAELDINETPFSMGTGFYQHDQAISTSTTLRVDILNGGAEKICWTGNGSLAVRRPDNTTAVGTLTSGTCVSAAAGVTGAYYGTLSDDQNVFTEWDVRVCASSVLDSDCLSTASNERTGRLWSTSWSFQENTDFRQRYSINGSLYAVVSGGAVGADAVIEMQMRGVSGARYVLRANSGGPSTSGGTRVGRSVPTAGNTVTAEYPLYLNLPASAGYNWTAPQIGPVTLTPGCGTGVVLGRASGTLNFTSNVTGQYVVVCDVNNDDVFDFAGEDDFSSFGTAQVGNNSVTWDGRDNGGDNAAPGTYDCVVRLNVGEFHYVAEDIETAYPGIRMFRIDRDRVTRVPVRMFWDDTGVGASENMPNGQLSPSSPLADGLDPTAYANASSAFYFTGGNRAQPNGNARAWGDFDTGGNGKGNNAFLDQFAAADTAISAPFPVLVLSGSADADSDGLTTTRECDLGSNPQDVDTDDDGVNDGFEASAGGAPNTDGDALINILDPDDDGDGIPTSVERGPLENGDGNPTDAANSDSAGAADYLDTDSDNDGVLDGTDSARTNPNVCRDQDADQCDDCTNTGPNNSGGSTTNDGTDTDADTACNLSDPDDDDDGVADGSDSSPLVDTACADADADGCDDCSLGAGANVLADGPDPDGDGACNTNDPDDDGDGVADGADAQPLVPTVCRDVDVDGCDDCALTGGSGSGGSVSNDGLDTDLDGACDAGDPDRDNDGVANAADSAPLDANVCHDTDTDSCDDCAVTGADNSGGSVADDGLDSDQDGLCDAGDPDRDNDGAPDAADSAPLDPSVCHDSDADGCDDCAVTGDDSSGGSTSNDGPDWDNDGVCDTGDPNPDADADGVPDNMDIDADDAAVCRDTDADGCDDCTVTGPSGNPDPDNDGLDSDEDGSCDLGDTDDDDDGVLDGEDSAPLNPRQCRDSDTDGCDDCTRGRANPADDGADADGDGRCDGGLDRDGDGVPDRSDEDDDNDGILDSQENLDGIDPDADADNDGTANVFDADDRGDGQASGCPGTRQRGVCDAPSELFDRDRDGTPNHLDLDADGDGIYDADESGHDAGDEQRDGRLDGDVGENGVPDDVESSADSGRVAAPRDSDEDGVPDFLDADSDDDGVQDEREAGDDDLKTPPVDSDDDGLPDYRDPDDDGDGLATEDERSEDGEDIDSDGDDEPDHLDLDDDGDGVPTRDERDPDGGELDSDADGTPNQLDDDDDGDGVPTSDERTEDGRDVDTDRDQRPDYLDVDDDGDGIPSADEEEDANADGTPDRLQPPATGTLAGGALCAVSVPGAARGTAWGSLGLLALAGLWLCRRRRAALALGLLATFAAAASARAQVALDQFNPAPLAADGFGLSRPDLLDKLSWSALVWLDYANDPLVFELESGGETDEQKVVADHLVAHAGFALGVAKRLTLFATLPVHVLMDGEKNVTIDAPRPDGAGLGDLMLGGRVGLSGEPGSRFASALELFARLPTAELANDQQVYSGDAIGSYEPALIAEVRAGRFDVRVRAGARFRQKKNVGNLELGHQLVFGLGMRLRLGERYYLNAEAYASTFIDEPFERVITPAEALFGVKRQGEAWNFGVAAGPGLVSGYGSPDVRVVGMLGYWPQREKPVDSDHDGLLDPDDSCPNEPEDKDAFEDQDGCPDPDNDKDGVLDGSDGCKLEPEDTDDFEDLDGCPDPDNDKDGVLDEGDACPLDPEDKDGFEDQDGCPDPDNDRDHLLDAVDRCPDQAEDYDAFEDEDGCPEEASGKVKLTCAKIEISEAVYFDTGSDRIQARSFELLDQVAAVLKQAKHVLKVRIEGHTDSRGNDAKNLDLSKRRAASVLRYLEQAGIEPERLESEGYGETQPIADDQTKEGRAQNRRVEFKVVGQSSQCGQGSSL
jgi:outer membrane protein OmpA-like peptidoglycan-associated protein